jgi:hypothetical protein
MPISRPHDDAADPRPAASAAAARHDEWLMDEGIRDSFPASDPTSSSQPGSLVGQRYATREHRVTKRIESDSTTFGWVMAGCAIFCAGFILGRGRRR